METLIIWLACLREIKRFETLLKHEKWRLFSFIKLL